MTGRKKSRQKDIEEPDLKESDDSFSVADKGVAGSVSSSSKTEGNRTKEVVAAGSSTSGKAGKVT